MQNWIFNFRSRIFLLLCVSFTITTILVMSSVTELFDKESAITFQKAAGNPIIDLTMQSITEIGDVFYILIFSIVIIILKKTRRIGVSLLISLIFVTLLTGYIKCGVDRERPDLDFLGTPFVIEVGQDTFALFCEGGYNASYPSGHAARAAVLGVILGYALSVKYPRGCYLLLLYPFLMSISRMYVLQHYPMDVIGGSILGVLVAGILAKKTKLYKFHNLET